MPSETYDHPYDPPPTWQQMLADPRRPICLDCGEPSASGRVGVAAVEWRALGSAFAAFLDGGPLDPVIAQLDRLFGHEPTQPKETPDA